MNRFTFTMLFLGLVFLPVLSIATMVSPSESDGIVTFSILTSGADIPDNYQVESIRIDQKINRISKAEIVLLDGNPAEETFQISESKTFLPGGVVEIRLGYENREKGTLPFSLFLTSNALPLKDTSCPKIVIDYWTN